MTDSARQRVLDFLEELNSSPDTDSSFKPGLAYATMRVHAMAPERKDTISDSAITEAFRGVFEARRDLHEGLVHLPAGEADRARELIRILEQKVADCTRMESDR